MCVPAWVSMVWESWRLGGDGLCCAALSSAVLRWTSLSSLAPKSRSGFCRSVFSCFTHARATSSGTVSQLPPPSLRVCLTLISGYIIGPLCRPPALPCPLAVELVVRVCGRAAAGGSLLAVAPRRTPRCDLTARRCVCSVPAATMFATALRRLTSAPVFSSTLAGGVVLGAALSARPADAEKNVRTRPGWSSQLARLACNAHAVTLSAVAGMPGSPPPLPRAFTT